MKTTIFEYHKKEMGDMFPHSIDLLEMIETIGLQRKHIYYSFVYTFFAFTVLWTAMRQGALA